MAGNPPTVLGVLDLFQTTVDGHTRESRRSATRLVGFQLTFNEQLDALSAAARGNYTVLEYQLDGRRLVAQSVPLRASYDPNADAVTLVLIGKHPFRAGRPFGPADCAPDGITNPSGAGWPATRLHHPAGGERHRAVSTKTSGRSREEPGNGFRWTVRSFQQRPDLDLAEEDLGPFGLDDDLALRQARLGRRVDHIAVDDVRDRVAVADHFHAVPLAGGFLDVAAAAESQDVLPRGVAAPPVEPTRVAGLRLAAFFEVQLAVGADAGFTGQAGLVSVCPRP